MFKRRFFVGSLGSLVWPTVMGITFASARLYAESGAQIYPCEGDAGGFKACADASANDFCSDSTSCTGESCACQNSACWNGSASVPVLACGSVVTCQDYSTQIAPCAGKEAGARCTPPNTGPDTGSCTADQCSVPGDGGFDTEPHLFCFRVSVVGDPSDAQPSVGVDASTSPAASPSNDDGGCSTTGGSTALIGVPVALGLLLAARRTKSKRRRS